MVDEVIAANPDHPSHERAGLRPVRIESPINLQEDLLSQVLGLIKPSREAICQVVNSLCMLADDCFPGAVVASQAALYQIRIRFLQPSLAPFASATTLPHLNQRGGAKKSFKFLFPF